MEKPLRPMEEQVRDPRSGLVDLDLFWPGAACGALVLMVTMFFLKSGGV
jgi:hypothetical protein